MWNVINIHCTLYKNLNHNDVLLDRVLYFENNK